MAFSKCLLTLALAILAVSVSFGEDEQKPAEELKVEVVVPPPADCERKTKKYDNLAMHYVGTLSGSGIKFDSSHDRHQPFEFQLGTGQVIQGWDEGLLDMCVGEKRKLLVPATKGYGTQKLDKIPANSDLTFEVELMSIRDGVPPPNVFKEIDVDEDKHLTQEEVSSYLRKQSAKMGQEGMADDDQHNELITQIFEHEDKDKDGYISHDEFSGPKHDEL